MSIAILPYGLVQHLTIAVNQCYCEFIPINNTRIAVIEQRWMNNDALHIL